MIIPRPTGPASLRSTAIAAISAYLSAAPETRHAELLRTELFDLLEAGPVSAAEAEAALGSADPAVVARLAALGVDLARISAALTSPYRGFAAMTLPHLSPGRRLAFFEVLSAHVPSHSLAQENGLMRLAISRRDIDLVDAVRAWSGTIDLSSFAITCPERDLARTGPDGVPFWEILLTRLDRTSPRLAGVAESAFELGDVRRIGLLLVLGADLGPAAREVLARPNRDGAQPRWIIRVMERATTNHGRLRLMGLGLTAREVLTLPDAELRVRLGGLSNRQRRAIGRKKRRGSVPASLRRLEALSGESVTPRMPRAR